MCSSDLVLIGFSRLYLYVHFPTDVLFAMVLGVGVGFTANLAAEQIPKLLPQRKNQ